MENTETVVKAPVTTENPEEVTLEEVTPPVQAGGKTDPNLLLKSLQEEREKRRMAEEKARLLEEEKLSSLSLSEDIVSDEGKILQKEIRELKSELTKKDVLISHPILKEKWSEFEEFRDNPDNKGMNMRTAAKAFLVENGLLDAPRKGLEKPTGGQRQPLSTGMTADDVKTLRTTNFPKYQEMLLKGQLKIE